MTDLSRMSAPDLVTGYSKGEFSPVDAARAALDAIAAHEQRGVDAVAREQFEHDVAERVGADRAGAAHARA